MKKLLQSFVQDHPMVEDARLFDFKKNGFQKLYVLWIALIIVVVTYIGMFIFLAPLSFPINWIINLDAVLIWREQNILWNNYLPFTVSIILGFGGVYFLLALYLRFVEKRSLSALGFKTSKKLKRVLIGFSLAILTQLIIFILVLTLTSSTLSTEGSLISGVKAIPWMILFLVPWAIQASAEEVIFQGWALPHLSKKYGVLTAIIVVPVIFTAIHLMNPGVTLIRIICWILYGIFAGLYFLYDRSIYGIAAYHIGWNWSLGQLFGATRYVDDEIAMSLLGLNRQGNALLTGGEFGSGGTLFEAGLLMIGIGVILYLQHRRMKVVKSI